MPVIYDEKLVYSELQNISKQINVQPTNASIVIDKAGNIIKYPDVPGQRLDVSATKKILANNLQAKKPIEIIVVEEMPEVKLRDINDIDSEISKAYTQYNENESNRDSNIKNAINSLNGTIILPNQVFSLNKNLGMRTEKTGYKNAPVIINSKKVQGIGGGVCQVATTLYKAVLLAELEVKEREPHSLPPQYIPLGQDATIAGNDIDLKFRNNLNSPIYMLCKNTDGKIIISILSKGRGDNTVKKIESQVLEVMDPGPVEVIKDDTLSIGSVVTEREEKKGYKVAVYRHSYLNNILTKRELISFDTYSPVKGIVKIGTK